MLEKRKLTAWVDELHDARSPGSPDQADLPGEVRWPSLRGARPTRPCFGILAKPHRPLRNGRPSGGHRGDFFTYQTARVNTGVERKKSSTNDDVQREPSETYGECGREIDANQRREPSAT